MGPKDPGLPQVELPARVADLVRSAERLSTILEHAPVMIDSFDEQGRCVLWNRECEKTLGWTQQEISDSADPLSLFYPDEEMRNRVLQTIGRADGTFREYRVQAKDGSSHIQMWADFELPTGELISVGHDITEQRTLEDQLRQSQKLEAIGRLSGGMAHDFNNLLTVVLGNVDLIAAGLPADDENLHGLAREVQRAARRGARLIRNLLTFSRRAPLSLRSVEPARVVVEIVGTLRRLLPESLEILLLADDDLPTIEADPDAMEQILINLGTNARDAMPEGGSLAIELCRVEIDDERAAKIGGKVGEFVSLAVRDSGSGMATQVREMAFEPFFTTKALEQGSGLGLAIVYGLMEQHGGFATLDSEPGIGTTVTVCFPVGGTPVLEADTAEEAAEPRGGSETILIAEDEMPIREMARSALEEHGYSVLLAANGEEALGLLQRRGSEIDLVVSDVVMPRLGGAELRRAARRLTPEVRFLLTTDYADRDVAALGTEHPLERPVLQKPWTVQELRARVREVLDS
jgi:PAS domain S-box-containing protein